MRSGTPKQYLIENEDLIPQHIELVSYFYDTSPLKAKLH